MTEPTTWSRIKKDHALDQYLMDDLKAEVEGLMGIPARDILKLAGKGFRTTCAEMSLGHFAGE